MKSFLLNWKTTLFGIVAGLMVGLAPFSIPGAEFNWKNICLALVIAGWGAVHKDFNIKKDE